MDFNKYFENTQILSVNEYTLDKMENIQSTLYEMALQNFIMLWPFDETFTGDSQEEIDKKIDDAIDNKIAYLDSLSGDEFDTLFNKTINEFYNENIIIERRKKMYKDASTIVFYNKKTKSIKQQSLQKFWPVYTFKPNSENDKVINTDETKMSFGINKIEYIDYARNQALIVNTFTNKRHYVSLNKIDKYSYLSDELSTKNTFTNLING